MNPLLFLDIDGVLNGHQYDENALSCLIDRECVRRLNVVFKETKCDVVLCSSWRYMILNGSMTLSGFGYMLRTHGIHIDQRLIGITKDDGDPIRDRGLLIQDWLSENHRPPRWAVLDDLKCGMERVASRHVAPYSTTGMSDKDALDVIRLLK